ncbi:EthD domain-containing protein [Agrobacterium vitis]|uniref:EthD domain-containing protein n=1 Tax=Agrobacterium vitis TaxID=373 RepID=UPI0012E79596|nr:EthD domain-containing protein [Agrobacterium vitis]MVA37777.1 EthD family reductase [Agrobacterium vitis]
MIKIILSFRRREGMSLQEFKDYRREVHAPLLFALPEAKKIRRFVVSYPVPAPNFPEPTYDAVVEAWFDNLEDMEQLYFCENFRTQVNPDHENFIDLSSVSRIVSEEIVVVGDSLNG